jgi:ubiquinone/menaquinone biosynthesis C-methylase UbiE
MDTPKSSSAAPQNIYDHPEFFTGYRALREADSGLNGALEQPAFHRLVPPLADRRVLDLGCGFGDFARYARSAGACSVVGIDVSRNMLAEARRRTDDEAISYVEAALEDYRPPAQSFDLVVSSLALHYVEDYASLVARIFDTLVPGGDFVFSVEHPVCTAHPSGWVMGESGQASHWPLDHYRDEGRRDTRWFVDGVVKYHRTVETYVNTLLEQGFILRRMSEPEPTAEALAARPTLDRERRRPPFLLLSASRPA